MAGVCFSMKYEVILFDVDETLFDFSASDKKAFHNAFLEAGISTAVADYHASYREVSKGLWDELENGKLTLAELGAERFRRLFLKHGLQLNGEAFNKIYLGYLGKEAHLMEGAEKLIDQLRNRLRKSRLAVITNGFKEVQESRISLSPLRHAFDRIITSEEAGYQKPDKRIFEYAFSKLQLSAEDKDKVLIVGDSLTSDMLGGINYGIDTCWFNRFSRENNTDIQPTYEIHSLIEVLEILQ